MSSRFLVTLDGQPYTSKDAARADAGKITERLKRATATECDHAEFCEHIRQGRTWCGGVFGAPSVTETGQTRWGDFVSQQIFALDVDNAADVLDSDGKPIRGQKRALMPGEDGYLGLLDALRRCTKLGIYPMCWYVTMGATLEPFWLKYRLVFDMGEPVASEAGALALIADLLAYFPEGDQACKNVNRLFFGSNGEVHDLTALFDGSGAAHE